MTSERRPLGGGGGEAAGGCFGGRQHGNQQRTGERADTAAAPRLRGNFPTPRELAEVMTPCGGRYAACVAVPPVEGSRGAGGSVGSQAAAAMRLLTALALLSAPLLAAAMAYSGSQASGGAARARAFMPAAPQAPKK